MRKVIIIDDRQKRKELHLSEAALLELNRLVNTGMLSIETEINPNFSLDTMLDSFDIIAIHRSYLANNSLFNSISEYTKTKKKHLIVFSGGISQNIILNKGHQLNINSADFYVSKLPLFIEQFCMEDDMQSPLLQYLYGKSWRLTLLLQYRYLLWTYKDIDDIDDEIDESLAEELQNILWDGDSSITFEEVRSEIEIEKERKLNS